MKINLQDTLAQHAAHLQAGDYTSDELCRAYLVHVEESDEKFNSFIDWDAADILARAQKSDRERAEGNVRGPLHGIPVGIKDLILVKDQPGRAASHILDGFVSPYSATCVRNLEEAGAIPFGRLNMDEFAMGSSTETSAYGTTQNPWDLKTVPGGSSGGSASAVAARQVPATLGTDTGGSIRQPASFCGVTGIKPSYGRVSRYGVIAFASSLDQVGPFAQTAEDCALLLEALCGQDPFDATTLPESALSLRAAVQDDSKSYTIGIPKSFMGEGLDPAIKEAVLEAAETLKSQGHTVVDVDLDYTEFSVAVYYVLATAEASSNLSRYDGVRYGLREDSKNLDTMYKTTRGEGFGAEVKRRIMLGTFALSSGYYDAYYGKAQAVRTLIKQSYAKAFEKVDAILGPTSPSTAFELGSRLDDPLQMYLADIYTISANLAGLPAMSFPCGFVDGLPVGAQLIGPNLREDTILNIAHRFQQVTDFHKQVPPTVSL